MLAPVALVVFAIACFAVLAGSGDGGTAADPADKSATSSKTEATTATKEPTRSSYKARSGDSFSSIAEKFGITATELQELNPDVDPLALQPGQRLKLKE